jgi:hypothetical protein
MKNTTEFLIVVLLFGGCFGYWIIMSIREKKFDPIILIPIGMASFAFFAWLLGPKILTVLLFGGFWAWFIIKCVREKR